MNPDPRAAEMSANLVAVEKRLEELQQENESLRKRLETAYAKDADLSLVLNNMAIDLDCAEVERDFLRAKLEKVKEALEKIKEGRAFRASTALQLCRDTLVELDTRPIRKHRPYVRQAHK